MRRARLRGQLLAGHRAPHPGPIATRDAGPAGDAAVEAVAGVVGTLVGVQAQEATAAALAVRARSRGLVAADVDRARHERKVVLTWSLRGTRHLHRADDVRPMLALLGPTFLRPSRRAEELGIAGAAGERAVRVLRRALADDGPLTRDEVKARLAPHGVDPSGQAAIHVIGRAALEGLLCVLPGERYLLLDDWLGPPDAAAAVDRDRDRDRAAGELARRYLSAFAPATPADFAAWSGLGLPVARRAWATIDADLVEVESPAGTSWLLASDVDRARAAAGRSRRSTGVRLLGAFDSLLLAYADRRLHLSADHAPLVNRGGGMVKPLLVVDGRVAGTWSRPWGRVEVHPFRPLTGDVSAAVEREAADVVRFLRTGPNPRS